MTAVRSFSSSANRHPPKECARFIRIEGANLSTQFIQRLFFGFAGKPFALVYDPYHPHKDEGGNVELSEQELVRQLNLMDVNKPWREPAYRKSLTALQDAKFSLGIKRDTPLVVAETKFGKDRTHSPDASPK